MSTSLRIHELNEYPEFKTTHTWKQVREFVRSVQDHDEDPTVEIKFPRRLTEAQKERFANHFTHNFYAEPGGRLFYRPLDADGNYRLNLQVIYPTQTTRNQVIKDVYNDDKLGLGLGEQAFWEAVASKYVGITKVMTNKFLKKQTDWQLTRPFQHHVNHPFTSGDGPNQRWYIDCVFLFPYGFNPKEPNWHENEMSVYQHNTEYEHRQFPEAMAGQISYRYLLTCVDGFSKKLWAEPLIDHTAGEVLSSFKKIIADAQGKPRCCVHDNGSEFQSVFKAFLKDESIRNVETMTYSPTGNIAERYNRILREKIRAGIVRHNNLEWIKHLQDYCQNINSMRHSGSRFTPNQIWSPGYRRLGMNLMQNIDQHEIDDMYPITDTSPMEEIRMHHRWQSILKANNILNRGEPAQTLNVFQPGDLVRVAGEILYSKTRARNKDGSMKKYNAIIWSPEIFRVNSVVNEHHYASARNDQDLRNVYETIGLKSFDLRRPRYNLQKLDGTMMSRQFYGSELQKIPQGSTRSQITPYRSGQLNRLYEYS